MSRSTHCLELRDVAFGPTFPAKLIVRGIKPAPDTLSLVVVVGGDELASADGFATRSGQLFVQGSGRTPLVLDPYDRAIPLRGVTPSAQVDVIRVYVSDGHGLRPLTDLGIASVGPS